MSSVNLAKKNRFIGFYTAPGFWAERQPDIETRNWSKNYTGRDGLHQRLPQAMAEVVYEYASTQPHYLLRICRDGFVMYTDDDIASRNPRVDYFEKWREALKYLNCLYLIIDSLYFSKNNHSYFQLREITRNDALVPSTDDHGNFLGFAGPIVSYALESSRARDINTYNEHASFLSDERIEHRCIIDKDFLDSVAKVFESAVQLKSIDNLNVISKALHEFKHGNYEPSLVLSWALIESWLGQNYEGLGIKLNTLERIRAWFCTGSRFPGASFMITQLERNKLIEKSEKKELDKVNKARNDYIHGLLSVTPERAGLALTICQKVIERKYSLGLTFNLLLEARGF